MISVNELMIFLKQCVAFDQLFVEIYHTITLKKASALACNVIDQTELFIN